MPAEFTPITTQEDFDKAIATRLQRERDKAVKETEGRFADYEQLKSDIESFKSKYEEINGQLTEKNTEVDKLNAQIKANETANTRAKVARELGIPFDMADRIKGETEDEMKEDAKILASFVKSSQSAPPLGDPEPPIEQDDKNAGLREMLKTLTNK